MSDWSTAMQAALNGKPERIEMNGRTYKHVPDGSRILAPGQLDPYTIERCAEVAKASAESFEISPFTADSIANDILVLKGEK